MKFFRIENRNEPADYFVLAVEDGVKPAEDAVYRAVEITAEQYHFSVRHMICPQAEA